MSTGILTATGYSPRSVDLKPMPLKRSLLFFVIPTAIGVASFYLLLPALHRAGVSLLWNYTISFTGMFPLLLGAALVAHRMEGRVLSWQALKHRFRIAPLTKTEWLWTAGLLVVYVGGQLLLMPTARCLGLSLIWGYLMQKTESIWGSALFHAAGDCLIVFAIFAQYAGM